MAVASAWDVESLLAFEQDIAEEFNAGNIRAPVHLEGGNEEPLIKLFEEIRPQDWVCGAWRMHYKCLLKGVPPDRLKADILAGHSITLCYPDYHIITSAIVGGILPVAVGLALAIRRLNLNERVYAFVGDMTRRTGIHYECWQYAAGQNLPITWVYENNGLSVCTPTHEVWDHASVRGEVEKHHRTYGYEYKLPWPHSGAGKRVEF